MRRGGLRPLAYLRLKLLQTDGGLYHPALALPLVPIASGWAPSLCGRYPASSLVRAHPSGSRLRRTSPIGSRGYLASVGFLHGARSPSLLHPMTLCACCRLYPAGWSHSRVAFECYLLPSPLICRLGARGFYYLGASSVRSLVVTARALAYPAMRGFVGGLRRQDFPCRRHPSYAAAIFCRFGTFTLWFHGYLQASQMER
jgi:hypothetical protein